MGEARSIGEGRPARAPLFSPRMAPAQGMLQAPRTLEPLPSSRGTTRVHPVDDRSRARLPRVALLGLALGTLWLAPLAGQGAQKDATPPAPELALPAATDALRPDAVLMPPGGPRVIRLSAPGSGLTALRLSVPIEEIPIEAGTAFVLQILALDRARGAAQPLGLRVEGSRTPWGVAYTVVGPAEEFDYLAYILREAVAEPRPDRVQLERARALAETERAAETAGGRLAEELRAGTVPGAPPLYGTPTTLCGMTEATLRDLWRRTHRREAMSLVVVGPEPVELVLASFENVGSGERSGTPPSTPRPTREPPAPRPDVLRQWYGDARVVGGLDDPRGAVVAALVSRRLRETRGDYETDVQLWDVGRVRVLAVIGAAYPRQATGMRRRVQAILAEATSGIGTEEVAPAVAALRFELLASARTPWGLAMQVGRYHDATSDPHAAFDNVQALDRVTPDGIRLYVADLLRRSVARAEVRP